MLKLYVFLLCICVYWGNSQSIYKTINSKILDTERDLKILLPRNYTENDQKTYPVVYVFDGDYLFEPVAGTVDYYSYWEDIPEVIVVGINQNKFRDDDLNFSELNSLPEKNGARFFEFIGKELIPFIEKKFKTKPFRIAIGHGKTANFINYYLIRKNPLFNAYITISPDLAPDMKTYLSDGLKLLEKKIYYYLATSDNDVNFINKDSKALNEILKNISQKNVSYQFKEFNGPTHYSLPTYVIPYALEHVFNTYRPISKTEYNNVILKLNTSPVNYLTEKYKDIETLYGIKKQIAINDFKAIEATIKKKKQWDYLIDLSKIAKKEYPNTTLSSYYLGMYYEKKGEFKKAIKTYKSAYVYDEIAGIDKNKLLQLAEDLQYEIDTN